MVGYLANAFFPDPAFRDPRRHRISVPCPADQGSEKEPWWVDRIARQAAHFRSVGYKWVMWPPFPKSEGGTAPTSTGYGMFDPYDLGSKQQKGSVETRFGSAERLQRAIAILRRNGIPSRADVVLHQRAGGSQGYYKFKGPRTRLFPNGVPNSGRWALTPACFRGGVDGKSIPPFSVPDTVPDFANDYPFGDECVYEHSEYMRSEAKRWLKWFRDRLPLDGVRIDDCKGIWVPWVREAIDEMGGMHVIGEYFDGNPAVMQGYCWGALGGRMSMLDFSVHDHLKNVFDGGSGMWALRTQGQETWAGRDGYHSVPFVDTPDTDNSPGQQLATDKRLAYAYVGQHSLGDYIVYHRDSSKDPGCYGLEDAINNQIWCHNHLCGGAAVDRYVDHDVLVTERLGHQVGKPGSLAAINKHGWNDWRGLVPTSFGAFAELKDYNGRGPDLRCDRNGEVELWVPHDEWWRGESHVCYGPKGVEDGQRPDPLPTTMVFEGSADLDLDIGPIGNREDQIQRVWCEKGTDLIGTLTFDKSLPAGESVAIWVAHGTNRLAAETLEVGSHKTVRIKVPRDGWMTLGATGSGMAENGRSFKLAVNYTATETLS